MHWIRAVVLVCLSGCVPALAGQISITGNLNADDANDVFLYEFSVSVPGAVRLQSFGYGGGVNLAGVTIPEGGFDAYLSLFSGSGPTAVFIASDDDSGCPPAGGLLCGDPYLSLNGLAPGVYTAAISAFANISIAENYGGGTLGDGFTGLGSYFDWRTGTDRTPAFALDISGDVSAVPEPSLLSCYAAGVAWIAFLLLRRRPVNN